jgi:hypothetical protein
MTATLDLQAQHHSGIGLALTGVVLAIAVAGGALAVAAFTGGHDDADHEHGAAIGEAIPTSYGSITFEHVATIGGLTPEELGGVTHGIQNLVLTGQAQVEVAVLVTNTSDHRINVVPDQFNLAVDGVQGPVPMAGSTITPMRLAPGGSVEATLTFVVPQSGAPMTVSYADPGGGTVSLPAGQLDLVSPAPDHAH